MIPPLFDSLTAPIHPKTEAAPASIEATSPFRDVLGGLEARIANVLDLEPVGPLVSETGKSHAEVMRRDIDPGRALPQPGKRLPVTGEIAPPIMAGRATVLRAGAGLSMPVPAREPASISRVARDPIDGEHVPPNFEVMPTMPDEVPSPLIQRPAYAETAEFFPAGESDPPQLTMTRETGIESQGDTINATEDVESDVAQDSEPSVPQQPRQVTPDPAAASIGGMAQRTGPEARASAAPRDASEARTPRASSRPLSPGAPRPVSATVGRSAPPDPSISASVAKEQQFPVAGPAPATELLTGPLNGPVPDPVSDPTTSNEAPGRLISAVIPPATTAEPFAAPPMSASAPEAAASPTASATTTVPQSATGPMAEVRADLRAPETRSLQGLEETIDQLAETRRNALASKPELTLRHHDFGAITMRVEALGNDLRATLSARDPGFVPAIQAALAERALVASSEGSASQSNNQNSGQRGSDQGGNHAGSAGQGWQSEGRYGSSPGSGQGTSQPYRGQTDSRDDDTASQQRSAMTRSAAGGSDKMGERDLFA